MFNPFKPITNFVYREFFGPNTKKVEKNWESVRHVAEWAIIISLIYSAAEPINPDYYELKKVLEHSDRYIGMQLHQILAQELENIEMEARAMTPMM